MTWRSLTKSPKLSFSEPNGGDLLMFTSNPALLEFLQFTNGRDLPEFVAAREVIERHVKSTANALAPYKHHALKASKGIIA